MSKLDKHITEVISLIKDMCPEAIIKVSKDTFEKEDADLRVYVPKDKSDEIYDTAVELTTDILTEEGYHIVLLMRDLEDYPEKRLVAV